MLWLTGLFFLTNATHAASRGYWLYAAAFTVLAATSYFYHSSAQQQPQDRQLITALDQLALWLVVLLGAYYWQQIPHTNPMRWVPIAAVTSVGLLGYGGALTESFVYSRDAMTGNVSHGVLHAISSMGHHAIIGLLPPP